MNDNFSEKDIKDTFLQYHPDLNTDEIWENIEPKLKKKKKRRFFFWLWFGVAGGLLFLIGKSLLPVAAPTSISNNTIDEDNVELSTNEAIETNNIHQDELELHLEDVEQVVVNNPISNFKKPSSSFKTSNSNLTNKKFEYPKTSPNYQQETTGLITKDNTINFSNNNLFAAKITSSESDAASVDFTITEKEVTNKKGAETNDPTIYTFSHKTEAAVIDREEEKEIPNKTIVKNKKIKQKKIKKQKTKQKKQKKKKKKVKKEKQKKDEKKKVVRKKKKNWYYESQFTASPILAIRSLRENPSGNLIDFSILADRSVNEKQREAFGSKISFNMQHRKGLVLTVGIEYQQLNEVLKNNETTTENVSQEVVVSIVEDRDGNIISSTSEQLLIPRRVTRIQRIYNKYRFINIPIGVGIAWTKRKQHYKIIGGLDVNASFLFKGQTMGGTNFKSKSGSIGLWLASEYHKPINNRLSLVIAPKLQLPLTPITSEKSGIRQSYTKLSLEVGVNYWLNSSKFKKKTRKL